MDVAVCVDRAFVEGVNVKWGIRGRPWSDRIHVFIRRDTRELAFSLSTWGRSEKTAPCKPARELWPEPDRAGALSQIPSLQNNEEICVCCVSHPICGTLLWHTGQTKTSPSWCQEENTYKILATFMQMSWPHRDTLIIAASSCENKSFMRRLT